MSKKCVCGMDETLRIVGRILELATELQDAVREGRIDLMPVLLERRQACIDELDAKPDAVTPLARDVLRRIAEIDAETETMLVQARQEVVLELGRLQQGRAALIGYGQAASAVPVVEVDTAGVDLKR